MSRKESCLAWVMSGRAKRRHHCSDGECVGPNRDYCLPHARMAEKDKCQFSHQESRQGASSWRFASKQGGGGFLRLAGASSLLNAVTSENTGQATRLRSIGDVWSVEKWLMEKLSGGDQDLRISESYFVWLESFVKWRRRSTICMDRIKSTSVEWGSFAPLRFLSSVSEWRPSWFT